MPPIKCPSCGLVNFSEATSCKRCQVTIGVESDDTTSSKNLSSPSFVASAESSEDAPALSERDANRKLFGQVVGGGLIALGLMSGFATAMTQDYSYLPLGGASLLIGAFVVVILTQPRYSESWTTSVLSVRVGITCTILGAMLVYQDGMWTLKSLVLLLGLALIVIGVVAFSNRGEHSASAR